MKQFSSYSYEKLKGCAGLKFPSGVQIVYDTRRGKASSSLHPSQGVMMSRLNPTDPSASLAEDKVVVVGEPVLKIVLGSRIAFSFQSRSKLYKRQLEG